MQQGNGVLRTGACSGVGTRSGGDLRRLKRPQLYGHRGALRHGHICACEDRRGDGVRLQSGHPTKHNERVGGDLARGIELAAWRVWAQTGSGGCDWVRPFLVAKVEFDNFFLDARPTAFNCLSSAIHKAYLNTVSPVFYPGGGLEGRVGGTPAVLQRGDAQQFSDDLRAIYETLV